MSASLPEHIDILRLARQGSKLGGKLPMAGMSRLRQSIQLQDVGVKDFADIELEFGVDDDRIAFIRGRAKARVNLTCQRCLEPMQAKLDADFLLGVVEDEARAAQLPEQYEPLVASEKSSSLPGIIEDELILALPLVALHEIDQCPATTLLSEMALAMEKDDVQGKGEEKLNNPFSVLSALNTEKESK